MDNNYILSVVRDYADECLREPRYRLPKGEFERRSYKLWAVGELLRHMEMYRDASLVVAVMEFVHRMDRFSKNGGRAGMVFSVARDVAADILDVLLAMR